MPPQRHATLLVLIAAGVLLGACGSKPGDDDSTAGDDDTGQGPTHADVQGVSTSGDAGAYDFSVTVHSPDVDCDQYADWWEVLSEDGQLIFRRILMHSHADEQPFTRGGGPVPVQADTVVIVRAHLNTVGYGGAAMRGSVAGGFVAAPEIDASFAAEVETQAPLPEDCLW